MNVTIKIKHIGNIEINSYLLYMLQFTGGKY
jgi:hypothetical protein